MAQALWAKAESMLAAPVSRKRTEGDMTILTPDRWDFGTMVRVAKFAAELETAVLAATAKPFEQLTDAELHALLELEEADAIGGPSPS